MPSPTKSIQDFRPLLGEGKAKVRAFISRWDKNGNGMLEDAEFAAYATNSFAQRPMQTNAVAGAEKQEARNRARDEELKKLVPRTFTDRVRHTYGQAMVDKFDLDKNGALDDTESAAFLAARARESFARHQIVLKHYDLNGNGVLDDPELQAMKVDQDAGRFGKDVIDKELQHQ